MKKHLLQLVKVHGMADAGALDVVNAEQHEMEQRINILCRRNISTFQKRFEGSGSIEADGSLSSATGMENSLPILSWLEKTYKTMMTVLGQSFE